jgi:predicted nucleic acid-binding protein
VLPAYSTFLQAHWRIRSCTTKQIERLQLASSANKSWVFLGLLLTAESQYIGIAAAADLKPQVAEDTLRELLDLSELRTDSIEIQPLAARWTAKITYQLRKNGPRRGAAACWAASLAQSSSSVRDTY